jgi:hypothetical protein
MERSLRARHKFEPSDDQSERPHLTKQLFRAFLDGLTTSGTKPFCRHERKQHVSRRYEAFGELSFGVSANLRVLLVEIVRARKRLGGFRPYCRFVGTPVFIPNS